MIFNSARDITPEGKCFHLAFLLAFLLLQAPGDGWTLVETPPREVKRVYWELFETTEVWVRLVPANPHGNPPLVNLIFQAYFSGRAKRDPYSGLPPWPKGEPERVTLRTFPLPFTHNRELSLRLVNDGNWVDLMTEGRDYAYLGCPPGAVDCSPIGIEAEIEPSLLKALAAARSVHGEALGFPFELTQADQLALNEFAERIGLSEKKVTQ